MAKTKVDNKLNVVIGTKSQITGDATIPEDAIEFAKIKDGTLLEVEVNDEYMEIQAYIVL